MENKMRMPMSLAKKSTVPAKASKRPYFAILFVVALLAIAGMSYVSSWHLHLTDLSGLSGKTMSTLIRASEDQLLQTADNVMHALESTANQALHLRHEQSNAHLKTWDTILPPTRKRLAYAITITKDGFFQDGAAVLAYSIMKYAQNSTYDISLIAFVHPNVTTSRVGLRRLGFHVIEVPTPVNTSAIKFPFLRDHIDKNGCCGAAELIKITSYRLLQYHRIIHLDADTMFLNPIDELFERDFALIYTTDPNMATHKGEDKMPVQGGFIVMKPSDQTYTDLVNIVMNVEFFQGGGWNRSKIGWFWGGMTVQGVLPYYYNKVTTPGQSQIVDRCYYNTMADTDPCSTQQLAELKSAHFTVCQKPWGCWKQYANRLCGDLHHRWFDLRKEAEAFYNIPVNPNACPRGGHKFYQPMELNGARLPVETLPFVKPDDSADRFVPIRESKYISNQYH